MNLFELSTLLSLVGGAIGGAVAVHRTSPSASTWLWAAAIALGLACGFGLSRLVAIGCWKHDKDPELPGWRAGALLGVGMGTPCVAAVLSFTLMKAIFVRRHLMSRFSMRQLRAPVILENRNCKSRIATFSYTLRAN
jgi:hypothetical protein